MYGKIHFLNTGHSDCIILESGGKIAMIDAAEDTEYPADKPHLNLPGYEKEVLGYLFSHFADENGRVNIEFVLGTHAHSDHIGGFDTVINNPMISVKKAYLKPYYAKGVFIMERMRWDNQEVYDQMLEAVKNNGVELVESFDLLETELGDFKIKFYNGSYKKRRRKFGENINSVVTLVTLGEKRAVLAGDLNYKAGDEFRLAREIGRVDLLKVGHHGYAGSTSGYWVKSLMPKYAVVCNKGSAVYPDVKLKLKKISRSEIIATADCNGAAAEFFPDKINIIKNIMGG